VWRSLLVTVIEFAPPPPPPPLPDEQPPCVWQYTAVREAWELVAVTLMVLVVTPLLHCEKYALV